MKGKFKVTVELDLNLYPDSYPQGSTFEQTLQQELERFQSEGGKELLIEILEFCPFTISEVSGELIEETK